MYTIKIIKITISIVREKFPDSVIANLAEMMKTES